MRLPFFGRPRHDEVEKLYSELAPPLVAYARSLGADHATAEDLVQRTFLALLESPMPQEPRPYLFRAVRNRCLNHFRDHQREVELANNEPWFGTDTVDRTAEFDIRRALRQLSDEQREVVMMHLWGGLTFQEAGDAIGIPANTAASRYRYALAALKRTLAVEEQS